VLVGSPRHADAWLVTGVLKPEVAAEGCLKYMPRLPSRVWYRGRHVYLRASTCSATPTTRSAYDKHLRPAFIPAAAKPEAMILGVVRALGKL